MVWWLESMWRWQHPGNVYLPSYNFDIDPFIVDQFYLVFWSYFKKWKERKTFCVFNKHVYKIWPFWLNYAENGFAIFHIVRYQHVDHCLQWTGIENKENKESLAFLHTFWFSSIWHQTEWTEIQIIFINSDKICIFCHLALAHSQINSYTWPRIVRHSNHNLCQTLLLFLSQK